MNPLVQYQRVRSEGAGDAVVAEGRTVDKGRSPRLHQLSARRQQQFQQVRQHHPSDRKQLDQGCARWVDQAEGDALTLQVLKQARRDTLKRRSALATRKSVDASGLFVASDTVVVAVGARKKSTWEDVGCQSAERVR